MSLLLFQWLKIRCLSDVQLSPRMKRASWAAWQQLTGTIEVTKDAVVDVLLSFRGLLGSGGELISVSFGVVCD